MIEKEDKIYKIFSIIAIVILFSTTIIFAWKELKYDNTPLENDEADIYDISLLIAKEVFGKDFNTNDSFAWTINHKGPLLPFIDSIFYLFLPVNQDTGRLGNFVILALTFIAMFLIEEEFRKKNGTSGKLSIYILFLFSPFFYIILKNFPETAMMPFILFEIYFIEKVIYSDSIKNQILLGLCIGLGLLTNPNFIIYASFPITYLFIYLLKKNGFWKSLKQLKIAIIITLLVGGWWYAINFSSLLNVYGSNINGGEGYAHTPDGNPFALNQIFYYFIQTPGTFGILITIAILISIIYLYIRKKDSLVRMLLGTALFSLTALTFILRKDFRYFWPLIPVFALIIGITLSSLVKNKKFVKVVSLTLFLFSFFAIIHFYQGDINNDKPNWINAFNEPGWDLMWGKIKEVNPNTIIIISDHHSPLFFFDEKKILKELNATIINSMEESIENVYEKPIVYIVSDPFCTNSTPCEIKRCNNYKKAYKYFNENVKRKNILIRVPLTSTKGRSYHTVYLIK